MIQFVGASSTKRGAASMAAGGPGQHTFLAGGEGKGDGI
jgi:hypothetical protein